MLTGFSLENFRSFAERTEIELRPLTLLFGYNNAGKSALIRALALMVDSARRGQGVLDLSSDVVREADFEDLRCRIGERETIRLGLSFEKGSFEKGETIEAEIMEDLQTRRIVASELRIGRGATTVIARWVPEAESEQERPYELSIDGNPGGRARLWLAGLAPRCEEPSGSDAHVRGRINVAMRAFREMTRLVGAIPPHFQWLGSVRGYPPRYDRYDGEPQAMGHDGSGAAKILAYDKRKDGALLAEVSGWYERCFNHRVDVDTSSDKRFQVIFEPVDVATKLRVNLTDTGEGITQVLPVLVAAAMARRRGPLDPCTLAIEQPELHLHTAVQAPLAEHLCQLAAEDKPPRMLIETHSENFLLGVQIQIAKGALPADRVLVYWVKQGEDGASYAQRIEFEEDGNPRGFPEKVFNENIDLAAELLEIREGTTR